MQQDKEVITVVKDQLMKELHAAKAANEDAIKHIDKIICALSKGCCGDSLIDWYRE